MKIYIDGENFRKNLERSLQESGVLRRNAILKKYRLRELLQDVLGTKDLEIFYYASRIKLPKGYSPDQNLIALADKIKKKSRIWLANIVSQQIQLIKAGNLKIKQSKPCHDCRAQQEILQEKGVDVRLAVDMMEDIYKRDSLAIGLLSSDTDLCPALHKARDKKAKVIYICFANSLNRAVAAASSETVAISIEKVKQYFER